MDDMQAIVEAYSQEKNGAPAAPATPPKEPAAPPTLLGAEPPAPLPMPQQTQPQQTQPQEGGTDAQKIIEQYSKEQQKDYLTKAQAANANACVLPPEQNARLKELGDRYGVPPAAVAPLQKEYEASEALDKSNAALARNPRMAEWAANNPDDAAVAARNFDQLDGYSKLIAATFAGPDAVFSAGLGRSYYTQYQQSHGGAEAADVAKTDQDIKEYGEDKESLSGYEPTGAYAAAAGAIGAVTSLVDSFVNKAPQMGEALYGAVGIGAGIGAVTGAVTTAGPGAIPGAVAGAATAGAAAIPRIVGGALVVDQTQQAVGQLWHSLDQVRDVDGKPIPLKDRQMATAAGAVLMGGIMSAGGGVFSGATGKVVQAVTMDAAKKFMALPAVMSSAQAIAKRAFVTGAEGSAVMGGMALMHHASVEIGEHLSGQDFKNIENDPATREAAVDDVVQSMKQGAYLFMAPGIAGEVAHEYGRAIQSRADIKTYIDLVKGVEKDSTRKVSPGTFESFMQSQTKGTPVENTYVKASKIAEIYKTMGVTPGADDGLLGKAVPDIAKQLADAGPLEGDVVIPTSKYLAHIAGTEMSEALKGDVRIRQDAWSLNELKEHAAVIEELVSRMGKDFDNTAHPEDDAMMKIMKDVHSQLTAPDMKVDEGHAREVAAVIASRYNTRAERLGKDPFDLYSEAGLKFRRGKEGENPEDVVAAYPAKEPGTFTLDDMEKIERDKVVGDNRNIADIIDFLKGDKKAPAHTKKPDSLHEFLGKIGGVRGDGGNMEAAGLGEIKQRITGKKGFQYFGKLVHAKGMEPDEARRAAEEAGYLKPGSDQDDLTNAMLEERSGRKVYAEHVTENDREGFIASAEDFDRVLGEHDIDYVGRDTADVIKEMEEKGVLGVTHMQQLFQSERGNSILAEGMHIVTLFKGADKSTIIHEMGHIWLNEMRDDALRADAPEQIKNDWEKIKKAIGHEGDGLIAKESHETFARMTEAYLMEGKAPSQDLRVAFRRFKDWMTKIYRTVKNLDVTMTDDTRQVFDRMLATDDEIKRMSRRQGVDKMFKTAQEAKMTDAEFKAYNDKAENAEASAKEQLLQEAMEAIRQEGSKKWNAAAKAIRPDIVDKINDRKDIRAIDWYKTGKLRDAHGKEIDFPSMPIDRKALEQLSPGAETGLPKDIRANIKDVGGYDPEEIATFLGYPSGEAMVKDLLEAGKTEKNIGRQTMTNYLADQEVGARLRDKFGMSDEELREKAEELVGTPDYIDLKLAELRALSKKGGKPSVFTRENVAAWADQRIHEMNIKQASKPFFFVRNAAKAGREAQKAVLKEDTHAAIQALQHQVLNMALADRARKVEILYKSSLKKYKYLADNPTIRSTSQEYLNRVHDIIQRFGFNLKRDPEELKDAIGDKTLSDFVAEKAADDRPVYVWGALQAGLHGDIDHMSVSDFTNLRNTVENLLHNGREEQSILFGQEKMDRDDLVKELIAQRRPGENVRIESVAESSNYDRSWWENTGKILTQIGASLRRTMDRMQALDNDKELGPYFKAFWIPLHDASNREMAVRATERQAWEAMRQVMPKGWESFLKRTFTADTLIDQRTGKGHIFQGHQLLGIALNLGNESNMMKMLVGEGWKEADVRAFLDEHLEAHHWQLIQGILNRFAAHFDETKSLYRELYGIAPTEIKATAIPTKFGSIKGGYFPVIFDANRAAELRAKIGATKAEQGVNVGRPLSFLEDMTSNARTKTRTKAAYPMLYDINMVPLKMDEALHDLAFRKAIINANKFLSDPKISTEIIQRLGKENLAQLKSHVKDIAAPYKDDASLQGYTKLLMGLRQNAVGVGILYRFSTIEKHFSSAAANSVAEVGAHWGGYGMRKFMADPSGVTQEAYDLSDLMKYRMDRVDADQKSGFNELLGESRFARMARVAGHYGVGMSDQVTAIPTFKAALDKARTEGKSETDAIHLAETAVLNAHGGSREVDLPAFLRGNSWVRLVTPFTTFMNHVYNRGILRTGREIQYGMENMRQGDIAAARENFTLALSRTLFYFIIPGAVIGNLTGTSKDDWLTSAAKGIAGEALGTIPLLTGAERAMTSRDPFELSSTLSQAVGGIAASVKDVAHAVQGEPVDHKWVERMLNTAGYLTGAPVGGQVAKTPQYLWDYGNGREDPGDAGTFLHDMLFGHKK